jgi:hypothetical protein
MAETKTTDDKVKEKQEKAKRALSDSYIAEEEGADTDWTLVLEENIKDHYALGNSVSGSLVCGSVFSAEG